MEKKKVKRANQQDNEKLEWIVSLMSVYLSEWEHRDTLFWSQIFKLFYGCAIISFVPNLSGYLNLSIPRYVHSIVFPVIGIIFSLFSLYVTFGYASRLKASGDTYRKLMSELPKEFRQEKVCELQYGNIEYGKLFSARLGIILPSIMFLSLITINLIIIIYS